MNALLVYFSRYGNTQKVAEAIAETLESVGSVCLLRLDQLTASDMQGLDLVVMGCPTYRMSLPEAARHVLAGLPKCILRGTPVAAFDTSYKISAFLAHFTAAKKLTRKTAKLGGKQIVPPGTFHVIGREGPLYEGEIERASEWAELILSRLGKIQPER